MVLTGLSVQGARSEWSAAARARAVGFNGLIVACLRDSRSVTASGLENSDVSVANDFPEMAPVVCYPVRCLVAVADQFEVRVEKDGRMDVSSSPACISAWFDMVSPADCRASAQSVPDGKSAIVLPRAFPSWTMLARA
jgi:hypothetical protein